MVDLMGFARLLHICSVPVITVQQQYALHLFLTAIELHGLPSKVCSDMGGENTKV